MNLLIPDPHIVQSYYILQGMHKVCKNIVVAIPRMGKFPRIYSFVAHSKYVTRRYMISVIPDDWIYSNYVGADIGEDQKYLTEILRICDRENINIIYPSGDVMVAFYSKYSDYFESRNVMIPIQNKKTIKIIMNKYDLFSRAVRLGIDAPATVPLDSEGDIKNVVQKLRFPIVLKPCYGKINYGYVAHDASALVDEFHKIKVYCNDIIAQEYIPGYKYLSTHIVKSTNKCGISYCLESENVGMRAFQNNNPNKSNLVISPIENKIDSLLNELDCVGFLNLQFKVDERDNKLKLIDVNPRMTLMVWVLMSLGVNVPHVNYQALKGECINIPYNKSTFRVNTLQPVRDVIVFIMYLWKILADLCDRYILFKRGKPFKKNVSLKYIFNFQRKRYFSHSKLVEPLSLAFFKDPVVSICYALFYFWSRCLRYPNDFTL